MEFGIWFLWLFVGLLGRREIDVFFEDKAFSFQDYELYFLRWLYSSCVGLNGNKKLNFLGLVDCIMYERLRA